MNCPSCKGNLNASELIQSGGDTRCRSCGAALKVTGLTAFWLAPTVLFVFLPVLAFLDGPGTILSVGAVIVAAVYVMSFWIFVDVTPSDQHGK